MCIFLEVGGHRGTYWMHGELAKLKVCETESNLISGANVKPWSCELATLLTVAPGSYLNSK